VFSSATRFHDQVEELGIFHCHVHLTNKTCGGRFLRCVAAGASCHHPHYLLGDYLSHDSSELEVGFHNYPSDHHDDRITADDP
jgi:hypothetical protein